jgi:class 3 adenylate cyclase
MHALPLPDHQNVSASVTEVIVVLDVVESVRLMERDELGFIRRWRAFVRAAHDHIVPAWGGRIHKSMGDGLMLAFADATHAMLAAFELLQASRSWNEGVDPEHHMHLRIAAHVACFVADEFDIYGNDVNVAARLAGLAFPGEVVVTEALRTHLRQGVLRTHDLGHYALRHVSQPVQVYRVTQSARPAEVDGACALASAAGWSALALPQAARA